MGDSRARMRVAEAHELVLSLATAILPRSLSANPSAWPLGVPPLRWLPSASTPDTIAAAVIRDYGDRRDADAYQRGKLEGARLALEAAATVAPSKTPSGECETVGQWTRRTLREAIRALDPAKIVGEG